MDCIKCKKNKRVEPKNAKQTQRWCYSCRNEYMRKYRKTHPLSEDQKIKDRARSYARVMLIRGKIKKHNCQKCSSEKSEMHHPDYTKPAIVVWLCRDCHMRLHANVGRV